MSEYEKGDFIKAEFPGETTGDAEWMWVRVHSSDDTRRIVIGTLDNAPANDFVGKLKLGTELAISFSQIREHKKAWEFDRIN